MLYIIYNFSLSHMLCTSIPLHPYTPYPYPISYVVSSLVLWGLSEGTKEACYDDLLEAFRRNHSLRAVYILGGDWKLSFLMSLLHISRVENARISTVVIEKVRG
jgi:hypothetical protein